MPRNPGGSYSLPAGSIVTDGTSDILASQHNNPLNDIAADLNIVRPIVAGGTGAAVALEGLYALGSRFLLATVGGTADAITLTTGASLVSVPTGMTLRAIATASSTSDTVTIDVDGIGAEAVLTVEGDPLPIGAILINQPFEVIYNGTNFLLLTPSRASRILLNRTVITGSPTTLLLTWDATLYSKISFVLENIRPGTDNVALQMYLSSDGGATFISSGTPYRRQTLAVAAATATAAQSTASNVIQFQDSPGIGNAAGEDGVSGEIEIFGPGEARSTNIVSRLGLTSSTGTLALVVAANQLTTAIAVNAAQFNFNSGNIAGGEICMYGERNQ